MIVRICAVAALAGLAGCHMVADDSCVLRQPYETAVNATPLRAAEGLPPANTKNALKIPDATSEPKRRKSADACLDKPPSFYADRPATPATKK